MGYAGAYFGMKDRLDRDNEITLQNLMQWANAPSKRSIEDRRIQAERVSPTYTRGTSLKDQADKLRLEEAAIKLAAAKRPEGKWSDEVGGWIYEPDEQNPQGRIVKAQGVTAKPKAPFAIPSGYRLAADGQSIERIPGYGEGALKPVPAAAMEAFRGNMQNMNRAKTALDLAEGNSITTQLEDGSEIVQKGDPEATGWKGYLPAAILNRIDPEGVDTRAAIADLGSLVIHDRSGAAVTAAEFPRLQPFIPTEKDDHETVVKKLRRFNAEYQKVQQEMQDVYGEDTGYKPLGGSRPAGKTIVREVQLKDGRIGVEYSDGTRGYK